MSEYLCHPFSSLGCLTMDTEERCSWSDLPHCLLELILECSTLLTDRLRFSFVCRSWHAAWHAVQTQWGRSQLPFFVLCSTINETSIEFFSPLQRRSYKTPIPPPLMEMRHCPSLGYKSSPHGWLLFEYSHGENNIGYLLFNASINKWVGLSSNAKKICFLY